MFFVLCLPASAQEAPQDTQVIEEETQTSIEESVPDESSTIEEQVESEDPQDTQGQTTDESEIVEPVITTPEPAEDSEPVEEIEAVEELAPAIPTVYISEINWAGSELSQADEWLELYNASSEAVDLGGWVLTGCATSGDALALTDGTMLAGGDVLLVSNYDLGNEKTTLLVQPDLVTASLSLSNSSQEILLTMPDGTVVDSAGDGTAPPAGSTDPKASMTRNFETLEWYTTEQNANLSSTDQLGTPGTLYATTVDDKSIEEAVEVEVIEEEVTEDPIEEVIEEPGVAEEPQDEVDEIVESVEEEIVEEIINEATEDTQEEVIEEPATFEVGTLVITEIVSDPEEGQNEWIELFNATSEMVDLTDWSVADAAEKHTKLEGTVDANGYFVVESPKGKLNNDGDSVYLYDPAGNLIDSMSYGTEELDDPSKGESLALIDEQWTITADITKSQANIIQYEEETTEESTPEPESSTANTSDETTEAEQVVTSTPSEPDTTPESTDDQSNEQEDVQDDQPASTGTDNDVSGTTDEPETHRIVAIAEAPKTTSTSSSSSTSKRATYSSASASEVTVSGIVTAAPGTFGSQIAFIEGAQLYFYYADWPMLDVGDIVTVTGELSESRGEQRVKLSETADVQITGHVDLYPTSTTINGLDALENGTLVTVRGEITDMSDTKILIQDPTGEVIAVSNDGMQWSAMSSELEITGILRTVSGEQRIYPRNSQDIVQIQEEQLTNEQNSDPVVVAQSKDFTPWVGGGLLLAALATLAYFFMRRQTLETAPAGA